jgi:F420H(2)-dependent quinone reductase
MTTGTHEQTAFDTLRERQIQQIVRTGTTDGVTMQGLPVVLMTFRGAKSGTVRATPLMRVEHEGCYAAVASNGGAPTNPKWYASLIGEPVVELHDGAVTRQYVAREVFGDDKALWWRRAVSAYPHFADYQRSTERQIPVFVLVPVTAGTADSKAAKG